MTSAANSESPHAIDDEVLHAYFVLRSGMKPMSASCLDGTRRRTQRTPGSDRYLEAFQNASEASGSASHHAAVSASNARHLQPPSGRSS